jgi:hypothetical protein
LSPFSNSVVIKIKPETPFRNSNQIKTQNLKDQYVDAKKKKMNEIIDLLKNKKKIMLDIQKLNLPKSNEF